jgi:hypothetical protein
MFDTPNQRQGDQARGAILLLGVGTSPLHTRGTETGVTAGKGFFQKRALSGDSVRSRCIPPAKVLHELNAIPERGYPARAKGPLFSARIIVDGQTGVRSSLEWLAAGVRKAAKMTPKSNFAKQETALRAARILR